MSNRKCENCKFWGRFSKHSPLPEGVSNWGECRKWAPIVMSPSIFTLSNENGTEQQLFSAFPQTAEDDWCGEHKSKSDGGQT